MESKRDQVRNRALLLRARATLALEQAGVESPALDTDVLFTTALGIDRSKLVTGSFFLNGRAIQLFHDFVARRAAREPIAYIVGHKEFYGLEFEINPAVLIPRPETELLVEAALNILREKPRARVLDLGTGSGAIAIALAVRAAEAAITATDISDSVLEIARRNARRHGCARRVEFFFGDLFAALSYSHPEYDLIVSNPPYVCEDEVARLQPEIARYEPQTALRGGKDGLDFYTRIAAEAGSYLIPGGDLIVEVGAGQAADVERVLEEGGYRIFEVLRDVDGHDRVVHARLVG